ncbi:Unannotated [Lentimonas sp. CC19]|nr:Unannotated [Lentimonas sp. CC19]CAA6694512.1 Unannotated [Lentimonas sp. CC10]CAA7070630.1 Unannotated [Lentimonas sp. CC11]
MVCLRVADSATLFHQSPAHSVCRTFVFPIFFHVLPLNRHFIFSITFLALLSVQASDTISVNFHVGDDSDNQVDHILTSGEMAGLASYATDQWNNIDIGNGGSNDSAQIFAATNLSDASGNLSVATLSTSADSTWFTGYAAGPASSEAELGLAGNDDDLFNSYLALNGPSGDGTPADAAILNVSGLGSDYTSGGYAVIVYSDSDKTSSSSTRTSTFTLTPLGESSIALSTEDNATFSESYDADGGDGYSNYVVFENLSAASFSLELTSPGGGGRAALSGFQIIPEPTISTLDIVSFTTDDDSIVVGESTTLSWQTVSATSLTLNPGSVDVTGTTSRVVSPLATTEYTLIASDGAGIVDASIDIAVGEPVPEVISFTADAPYLVVGESVVLRWETAYATTLTLDPGGIDVTGTTSLELTPTVETTYTLTASDGALNDDASTTIKFMPAVPNILIFLVDDMGITDTSVPFVYDEGVAQYYNFNYYNHTPNMETLASQGMKFTQAYATPVCSSTRVSLMSGYNTTRHGVISQVPPSGTEPATISPVTSLLDPPNNWKRTGLLESDKESMMPWILREAGYRTIHAGKAHFSSTNGFAKYPTAIGFDVNLGGTQAGSSNYTNYGGLPNMSSYAAADVFLTDALTQAMNSEIGNSLEAGLPFFAYMSHYGVHSPFTNDPNATADYTKIVLPDESEVSVSNSNQRIFGSMLEGMDQSLGSILEQLDALGVAEETLVIFMGDNGSDAPQATYNGFAGSPFSDFPLRGKKGSSWEGGIRVPMIVAWAKVDPTNPVQAAFPIPQGTVEDDLVVVWDILPTVLNITEVEAPHVFDGYDLTPYLLGHAGTHRPQEMLMYLPIDHRNDYFSIYRDEEWKLIYFFATDSYTLYNLDTDPTESNDVAGDHSDRVMAMARSMAQEFERTWGDQGQLWPTFDSDSSDDPFSMPNLPAVDLDMDGLGDNSEDANLNGLIDAGETDPDDWDTDGDRTDDYTERRLNLDPLDANSFFAARVVSTGTGNLDLAWPSAPGLSFDILSSDDLSTPFEDWTRLISGVEADDTLAETIQSLTIDPEQDKEFYSVELLP